MKDEKEINDKPVYTDEQINELAEWMRDLTIDQAFFLRDNYESFIKLQAATIGNGYIH